MVIAMRAHCNPLDVILFTCVYQLKDKIFYTFFLLSLQATLLDAIYYILLLIKRQANQPTLPKT